MRGQEEKKECEAEQIKNSEGKGEQEEERQEKGSHC